MFTKEERSSFPYWFAHWCAFNMTALNLKVWKPRHLLHDIEKPWLRLFMSYDRVQEIHRVRHKHHIEYFVKYGKVNWCDLCIDWECSRFTKITSPYTCRQYLKKYLTKHTELSEETREAIRTNILAWCDKLGI
jgi:hypothetical protein